MSQQLNCLLSLTRNNTKTWSYLFIQSLGLFSFGISLKFVFTITSLQIFLALNPFFFHLKKSGRNGEKGRNSTLWQMFSALNHFGGKPSGRKLTKQPLKRQDSQASMPTLSLNTGLILSISDPSDRGVRFFFLLWSLPWVQFRNSTESRKKHRLRS